MAWNATYRQLQNNIADELGARTDLLTPLDDSMTTLSPIQAAIQSAIAMWEREPFWFNEEYFNVLYNEAFFYATPEQEFYSPTSTPVSVDFTTIPKISKMSVMVNNNRYEMYPRTWQYIESISVNPSVHSEFPIDYAFFGGICRLYPIPAEQVPIAVTCNQYLAPLVNDADTNAWTTVAYDLTRATAKLILAQEVLSDDELAERMRTAVYGDPQPGVPRQQDRGYLYSLRAESARRGGGAKLKPTYF